MITQSTPARNPFALDPATLDTPAAQAARAAGLLQMKRAAAQRAERLAKWARPLLVALLLVSALHIFGTVARYAPATVEALALPAAAYHGTAGALTLSIDLAALYLVAAAGVLRLAGERPPRLALGFFLGLTFALNLGYMVRYAPDLDPGARAYVLPLLDAGFVVLLPAFIPIALFAIEGAAQRLEAARLALLVEAAALRPLAEDAGQGDHTPPPLPAPAWVGPVLVGASWPREQPRYPAPVRVEPMRADGVTAPQSAPAPAQAPANAPASHQEATPPHPCPRCGAPLTRGAWLAAKRWGRCASCKGAANG